MDIVRTALATLATLVVALPASADVPPPPGQTRVAYAFRVTGVVEDAVVIAFPMYGPEGSHVVELTLDQDASPVQGYRPGIYSLSRADAAALKGKDDEAIKSLLAKSGHVCVKEVPRVFAVATETKVRSIVDVFAVEATASACKASVAKTLYGGDDGLKGEGTIDAAGKRVAPSPFGQELPPAGDLGLTKAAKSDAAPPSDAASARPASSAASTSQAAPDAASRGGCAGCSTATAADGVTAGGLAFALGCLLAAGRGRRRKSSR